MSDTTNPSPRLQEFQSEVDSLKVTGGKANPERTWVIIGALLMIAGIVMSIISYASISGSAPLKGQVVFVDPVVDMHTDEYTHRLTLNN